MTRAFALAVTVFLGAAVVHAGADWPTVGLVEATPSGYSEKGRFQIPEKARMSWAHPAISDGRLYVRNQDTVLVYDIKAPTK